MRIIFQIYITLNELQNLIAFINISHLFIGADKVSFMCFSGL